MVTKAPNAPPTPSQLLVPPAPPCESSSSGSNLGGLLNATDGYDSQCNKQNNLIPPEAVTLLNNGCSSTLLTRDGVVSFTSFTNESEHRDCFYESQQVTNNYCE